MTIQLKLNYESNEMSWTLWGWFDAIPIVGLMTANASLFARMIPMVTIDFGKLFYNFTLDISDQ